MGLFFEKLTVARFRLWCHGVSAIHQVNDTGSSHIADF